MKIVIEIDEDTFKKYQESVGCEERAIIVHGTPLPKGHGDLKDVNDIWNNIPDVNVLTNHFTTYDIQRFIDNAPTIIEADNDYEADKEI